MKKQIAVLLSFLIFYWGCVSTHRLSNFSEARDNLEGENVSILMQNGKNIKDKIISIGQDSLLCSEEESNFCIPASDIKEIAYKKGSFGGVLLGALFGVMLGMGIASYNASQEEMGGLIGLVTVPLGFLIGLLAGAGGKKHKYVVTDSTSNEYIKLENPYYFQGDSLISNEPTQAKISTRKEYVKLEIDSIEKKTDESFTVMYKEKEITLEKPDIVKIERINDKIILKILKSVYLEKFK